MITSRWLSTLSWNSQEFLKEVLDDLLNRNIISFYYYIYHLKEFDEKKNHYHLFLIPNKRIDTDTLRNEFDEIDLSNSLPIRVLPFRPVNKFADKYLYDIHDEDYLKSKNIVRKYHYKDSDFNVSDEQYFNELKHEIDYSRYKGLDRFKQAVMSGLSFELCAVNGLVPIQQYSAYKSLYKDMTRTRYKRVDEFTIQDIWTGEFLDNDFKSLDFVQGENNTLF